MKVTINDIEYQVFHDGKDIVCIPMLIDDHSLILYGGYEQVYADAYQQSQWAWQVTGTALDLMPDYVLENKEQLIKIQL